MAYKMTIMMMLISGLMMSQEITISGTVRSSDDVLPGANIIVKGTSNGTTTSFEGDYTIKAKRDDILVFTYVGFLTKEVPVDGRSIIDVVLEEDAAKLDEVVVKGFSDLKGRARKRLESIQTVPESITAVTSQDMELTGVEDIGGLLTQIPGVSYGETQDPGTVIISVRGIPQIRYGPSPIATVVDGVYMASPDLNNQALFDIDQIEVIKGSQGLFYGKNAIGGAVVITTKQPSNSTRGRVKVGYGNGNAITANANIGGAIVKDKVFYRLGVSYSDWDGLIENVTLNENVDFRRDLGLRGQLKFKLGSKSTLSFTGQHGNNKGGSITYVSSASENGFPDFSPNVYEGNPDGDYLGEGTVKSTIGTMSFETNFTGARLSSHTSYSDVELYYDGDYLAFDPIDNYVPFPWLTKPC